MCLEFSSSNATIGYVSFIGSVKKKGNDIF
jgi:hypothetical protein